MKYYVNFVQSGVSCSHCFENDEHQARHFASLVNGDVIVEGHASAEPEQPFSVDSKHPITVTYIPSPFSNLELMDLCDVYGFFKHRSPEHVDRLFRLNSSRASLSELSVAIWMCSWDVPFSRIYGALYDAWANRL